MYDKLKVYLSQELFRITERIKLIVMEINYDNLKLLIA
jgi:hypothetical protein